MDADDQYWKQPTVSSTALEEMKRPAATSPAQRGRDRSSWIAAMARQVLSSYRRDDFADPEGYLVQLGMVLERYSDEVIAEATSPLTGIQRTCKFPPTIAEFVDFCGELTRTNEWAANWDRQARKQLKERAEFEARMKEESAEHRRAVVKRLWPRAAEG